MLRWPVKFGGES